MTGSSTELLNNACHNFTLPDIRRMKCLGCVTQIGDYNGVLNYHQHNYLLISKGKGKAIPLQA
jgi:hypothetical protein